MDKSAIQSLIEELKHARTQLQAAESATAMAVASLEGPLDDSAFAQTMHSLNASHKATKSAREVLDRARQRLGNFKPPG